jgi:hypothetical protein
METIEIPVELLNTFISDMEETLAKETNELMKRWLEGRIAGYKTLLEIFSN